MSTTEYAAPARGGRLLLPILSSAYIAVTLNVQSFLGMLPLIREEFALTAARAGLYNSFHYLSATVVAIASGYFVDRLGSRRGALVGVGSVTVLIFLHAISPSYTLILALAFLTGIGFSLITPSVSSGIVHAFGPTKRAGAMGLVHGGGTIGAMLGAGAIPAVGVALGWRAALALTGLVAFLIFAAIRRYFPALPDEQQRGWHGNGDGGSGTESSEGKLSGTGPAAGRRNRSFSRGLAAVLRTRSLLTVCLMGVTFGMSYSSATNHMALFLTDDLGYSPVLAGIGLSVFHGAGVVGGPAWGAFNDRVLGARRRGGLVMLVVLAAAMMYFFGFVVAGGLPYAVVLLACALLGFIILGISGLYFTTVGELAPAGLAGVATGVALVFARSGVVLASPLFGLLSDITGSYRTSWIALGTAVLIIAATFRLLDAGRSPGVG